MSAQATPSPSSGSTSDPLAPTAFGILDDVEQGRLRVPEPGRWAAEAFVAEQLGHLVDRRGVDLPASSSVYRGGQRAADAALAAFDVAGYAARKDEAYPQPRRTVSGLSPWVRHGLLDLRRVWDHVEGGPDADVREFRGELLWQEYARHRYARRRNPRVRRPDDEATGDPATTSSAEADGVAVQRSATGRGWDRRMGCVEIAVDELEEDGWLVNRARRWLASQWVGASGEDRAVGEEHFFRHLLDGSRAANGLGWTLAEHYPFTRWEVEERAAGLCASCELVRSCPIERPRVSHPPLATAPTHTAGYNDTGHLDSGYLDTGRVDTAHVDSGYNDTGPLDSGHLDTVDPDATGTAGPRVPVGALADAEAVWLTAESIGDGDPALAAHPDLPAVFVFDEPLLARLRLSSKRLVFLTETLSELGSRRTVELYLGDPADLLAGRPLAATFTPVPGWRRYAARLDLVVTHPWRWLRQPHGDDLTTFDRWRSNYG